MKLTLNNPGIISELANLQVGLMPMRRRNGNLLLIIKCSKEMILTAKIRKGFRFYLAPIQIESLQTYGLITAFFDDHDEPLTIRTPLVEEEMVAEIFELLSLARFEVYFFDEHNREMLGYSVRNNRAADFRSISSNIRLASPEKFLEYDHRMGWFDDQMLSWFGDRDSVDDRKSLAIDFDEALFPDDPNIQNARPTVNSYHGRKGPMHTILERENPGPYSELDIVQALQRVFASDQIYLNPTRPDDGREFVDILVATPKNLFLIQAKDSPNTEEILNRPITRKKSIAVSHLEKAVAQMRGSISYARSCVPLKIAVNNKRHEIPIGGRDVVGLIIVKELFDDEFAVYSRHAFKLFEDTGVPCLILDYPQFHAYTLNRQTEDSFIETLKYVLAFARKNNKFPRVRFWPQSVHE